MAQVQAIRLVTKLNEGIYREERDAHDGATDFPATRAGLALALDTRDYTRIINRGSFGSIGAGGTWVEIDTEDGTDTVNDLGAEWDDNTIGEVAAFAMLTENGELTRDALNEVTGSIWDGNNHVEFVPRRSQPYCSENDVDVQPWGSVTYTFEGGEEDGWRMVHGVEVSPDWVQLGWRDRAGFDETSSHLTEDQFDRLLDLDPLHDQIERFDDDSDEATALFCKREDLPAVLATIPSDDNE